MLSTKRQVIIFVIDAISTFLFDYFAKTGVKIFLRLSKKLTEKHCADN